MRLTKIMQQAFVRAAMDDVPKIDYTEKIRSEVNKEVAALKTKLNIQYMDTERLNGNYRYYSGQSFSGAGLLSSELDTIVSRPKIVEYAALKQAQDEKLNTLHRTLTAAIAGCTTRKQAIEALPEFEKYLPEDAGKAIRSVPALANILSDFVKAGWLAQRAKAYCQTSLRKST